MYELYPIENDEYPFSVISSTEATGLIPAAMEEEYEQEMYEQLFPYYLAEEEF